MIDIIEAVYEKGVFRPVNIPELSEGQAVRIILDNIKENTDDILELAAHVYEGLSVQDINEVEQIAFNRSEFFEEKKRQ